MAYDGRGVHAIYAGTYITGDVWVEELDLAYSGLLPIVIPAKQFADVVPLFRDQQITLSRKGRSLEFAGKDRKMTLGTQSEEPAELLSVDEGASVHFTMPANDFLSEVKLAAEFVSISTTVPILTGVRLVANNGRIGLMAYDGIGGLFVTSLDCDTPTPLDVTVPPYDLINAVELIGSGPVTAATIQMPSGAKRLAFFGSNAIIHSTILNGKWPDVSGLIKHNERSIICIPAEYLDQIAAGAKALNADNVLIVEGGMNPRLTTKEAEHGVFEVVLPDAGYFPIPRVVFDIAMMKLAAKIGKDITLEVANSASIPTLVQSGKRRYWISRRVE